jgi:Ca-activated chloride channel homolog
MGNGMAWQWPVVLWLLGMVPLSVAAYWWVRRQRRKYAVRYTSLALIRAALPAKWGARRHVPFALYLFALGSLVGALARPMAAVPLPRSRATVMLVMDVSLSMCATDIAPTRLEAAQGAALSFIEQQAPGTQIGLVAFASLAALVQPPTTDQRALQQAVQRLDIGLGTALGSGLDAALRAIGDLHEDHTAGPPPDRAAGEYAPEIIVLLTDGVTTVGEPPLEAAARAAERGVRVFPIGFGTPNGSFTRCGEDAGVAGVPARAARWTPQNMGGGYHEGVDEPTLRGIAAMTGGTFYHAASANELQAVLADLPLVTTTRTEWMEVSVAFAALGAVLALAAVVLGMRWNGLL